MLKIRNSSLSDFLRCRKKYILGLEWETIEEEKSPALIIGTAYHKCMEKWDLFPNKDIAIAEGLMTVPEDVETREEILETSYACMELGIQYNIDNPQETASTETEFEAPLIPGVVVAGRIDALIENEGKFWIKERKTSGTTEEKFFKPYLMDKQSFVYIFGGEQVFGHEIMGVCVEVVFKPTSKKKGEVQRQYFSEEYSKEKRKKWLDEVMEMAMDMVKAHEEDNMYRSFICEGKYGYCGFWDYCTSGENINVFESTHVRKERKAGIFNKKKGGDKNGRRKNT